tara:strand:- start:36262 stop:38037 length:1776 start_codon:yes stop_codon:yes gene_type:complete
MAGLLPGSKSNIEIKIATDDQIFKRLNKKINRLDMAIGITPTIQNQGDVIKPDGTIARTDDDIRIVQGIPLRTPTGILEYKEEEKDLNYPLKVPLTVTKYDIESFMDAVDTNFSHYLSGYDEIPLHAPDIQVLDGPKLADEKEVQVVNIPSEKEFEGPTKDETFTTAEEEFGEDMKFMTEINTAGDLTGVSGTIWVVWRGFKYRIYNGQEENSITSNMIMTSRGNGPVEQNQAIAGLTNTKDGRNLEVILKDRDMSYDDVEIVPHAEIAAIPQISDLTMHMGEDEFFDDDITWRSANDGWEYNTNEMVIPGHICGATEPIMFKAGDIIKPSTKTESGHNIRVFLPNQRNRWTEFHPFDTNKPAKRSQIYTPNGREVLTKEWENKLLRCYNSGISKGYFIICRGEMHYTTNNVFSVYSLKENLPFQNTEEGNNWAGYHGNTYTIMDWGEVKRLGYPNDKRLTKTARDPDETVNLYEHGDYTGTIKKFGVGTYKASADFEHDTISAIRVPRGYRVHIHEHGSLNGKKKTLTGPWTDKLRDWWNDNISSVKVEHGPQDFTAGGGKIDLSSYKEYIGEGDYYKKPHLADYNKLFD